MEKYWTKSLFAFIVSLLLSGVLYAQEKSVYGKVIDPQTQKGIANINILNKRNGQIVATNENGDFYLRALKGDSILISTFGYNRKGFLWDGIDKNPVIKEKLQPIMLRELVVEDKRWAELNRDINLLLANPYDSKTLKSKIWRNMLNSNTSQPGIGISIDGLYQMYSKEGKANRKLADLQFQDIKTFYADIKYNKQTVIQITKLPEEEVDAFMKYCKIPQDFILKATDYELTFRILKCLGGFRTSRIVRPYSGN